MNGGSPDPFVGKVGETARRYRMDLSRPLVLVSGGPDSVALLRALLDLGEDPAVLHVDHGLRGEESRADARFVRGLCAELGVRCEVRRLQLRGGSGVEERARRERYRLAREVSAEIGMRTIVTGHTADDVAETVLLNVSRGAGLRGLGGIPPVAGRVVRPLIGCRRSEVLAYLERLGQPYRTDSTNLLPEYARNRVRLEVVPVLEELYPGAASNIARMAALVREDLEALEEIAGSLLEVRGEEVFLVREKIEGAHPALRRHAVRMAYDRLRPGSPPPEARMVEDVLGLLRLGGPTKTLNLPGDIVAASRPGGDVALYRRPVPDEREEALRPGVISFSGWTLEVREVSGFNLEDAARPEVAYLDASRGPYRLRMTREGDTMRPLGLGGRKKVMRAMMDRKMPRDRRRRTPVVVDERGEVAWILLGELGEEFKVGSGTSRALRLEVKGSPWR
ncbi:tRNA lysidine(34) synthetase TilS [Rubrobacter calidifluminis]|uniref:tRNA lysidine(34) synthetase TilS n=1 Tax=Rubrobacter calidifluminis TaxID=1392640 RepID=UPI002360CC39|nr:tRNA lysidine(34) synthetase TilS [Rubrobacter calidifluminis]